MDWKIDGTVFFSENFIETVAMIITYRLLTPAELQSEIISEETIVYRQLIFS